MSKLSVSTLQKLLDDVDGIDLSLSKKETIKALASAELARRQGSQLEEFQRWVRMGDVIIENTKKELQLLKSVTSEDAKLVSLESVLTILQNLKVPSSDLPYDAGRNWVLQRAAQEIEKLPKIN